MNYKHLVKVVIPFYKTDLSEDEELSLHCCKNFLKNYPIVFVQPKGLDSSSFITNNDVEVINFPKEHFESIESYNKLMLSDFFYEHFLDCKYILLFQLDGLIFKDELEYWCKKDYDYIGAPWLVQPKSFVCHISNFLNPKFEKSRNIIFNKVGNGGVSLRKVASFYKISKTQKDLIQSFRKEDEQCVYKAEDVFWSIKVPELYPDFAIPDYKEAIKFSIDRKPKLAFQLTNQKFPFACHGFTKPKVKNFWKEKLKEFDFKLE